MYAACNGARAQCNNAENYKYKTMLLQKEIPFVESKIKGLATRVNLQEYANELKESKEYNDFETRLVNDIIRAACGISYLCGLYDKYGAKDSHITTLAKKAIKCLNLVY